MKGEEIPERDVLKKHFAPYVGNLPALSAILFALDNFLLFPVAHLPPRDVKTPAETSS